MKIRILLPLWVGLALPLTAPAAPETTPQLVAVLESDASLEEKAIACRKLGEFGTPEAVPALARLLGHEVLGAYARSGLERIPDPSASAALRAALETLEGERLIGVITSLGALRDEPAAPRLGELAAGDDATVARAALLALGRVANAEAVRTVKTALASGQEGAAAAALLAAEQQLAQGRGDVALALYDAVRVADVPPAARRGATRGAILARDSVPFLMEQLASDDAATRDVALLAVREMPSAALADALHARLIQAPPELRVPLILALADCHNRESFGVVRSQLGGEEPQVRMAALKVVSTVGRGPELATTLLDVVEARPSPEERQVALGLLTRMEGEPGVNRAIREGLRHAEAEDMRIDVMRVLGDRQAEEAVGDLLAQAGDESPRIRAAAFRSMRRLVGPAEVTSLIPLTEKEENASARTAAISTLVSACGDDEGSGDRVLEELEEATDATEADTWIRVLTAVGHPRALPVILEGLEDEDEEVVAATITHLSRWPDPAPVETLLPFLGAGADPRVRPRAVSAVIRLTTQAADGRQRPDDVLVTWFAAANGAIQAVPEKRQLLSGLGRVHTLGSLRLLEPYLRDPEVEVEALYALLAMGSPLVKAGEREAVREVLPAESAIEDQELRWRIARLRRQVEEAESPE